MNDLFLVCLDELEAVGECWIEKNSFGDNFDKLKDRVCNHLDSIDAKYELHTFDGKFHIRLV